MEIQTNRDFVYDYAKYTTAFGNLVMQENADLVMFYCFSFLKDHVYYIKSLDVIAIATFNNQQLNVWDVFAKQEVELDQIIRTLIKPDTNEVCLGDETLFIQKGKADFFEKNKLMFPLMSHA